MLLAATPAPAEPVFVVEPDLRGHRVERTEDGCRLALEVEATVEGGATLLGYRRGAGCAWELARELAAFAELLDRALTLVPADRPARTLFWRRIEQPALSERLAATARDSGLAGADGATLQRRLPALLDARGAFAELVAIFAARGLALRVAGLEKLERPRGTGARPPYAALLWFRIETPR